MEKDFDFRAAFAEELATDSQDPAIWEKALAYCKGDVEKAKALYVRMRELDAGVTAARPSPASTTADAEMQELRRELSKALRDTGKTSLYDALVLQPTTSDADVARRIAFITGQARQHGRPIDAACKYAIEILGNAASRERYDRKLSEDISASLANDKQAMPAQWQTPHDTYTPWWTSGKLTMLIAGLVLVAVGYMLASHRKVNTTQEAVTVVKEIEMRRTDNERYALEQRAIREEESQELRKRALDMQEERERAYRTQIDRRSALETQQMEIRRREDEERSEERKRIQKAAMEKQAIRDEERRAEKERRYWACMNNALNRNTYDRASSMCASYR